ncbi:B-cadherin-like isoform X1 [Poecilia formosa]|uniref:B-cadherin-like isoform X1 n=1 Tax=Poecilia formosa TaxID=48698 RepID=UPI000443DCE6|nr:PREDICTED: B-cadherin-like isoform X1 [Poecilia formosa]
MGTNWLIIWSVAITLFQVSTAATVEESSCVPGFESKLLILNVTKKHLTHGTLLGKVGFTDCTGRTRFLFSSDDSRFLVRSDGMLTVKRRVILHEGHQRFSIHSLNAQGQQLTLPVMVLYQRIHHRNNEPLSHTEMSSTNNTQDVPQVPILHFPKSNPGLKRRKRDWVIPPMNVAENHRGPFPQFVVQIRSDGDKTKKILYSITGPGADEPPVGLFTMDRDTGYLYLTQGLDREKQDKYTLKAHAATAGSTTSAEEPMDIIINVIDQNDNKPVFKQSTYKGEVPEASKKDFEMIQVEATDADQPNTDNSDIRYRIMSQKPEQPSPNMFTINPTTGVIRVNEAGLDREKVPEYELEVQAADMKGEGLTTLTKVMIKVTDINDHAPVFTKSEHTATVEENKVDDVVVKMEVTDGDEPHTPAWNAKFSIINGDPGNLFTVKTGTNKQEGIITTAKGLDFEKASKHTLLVTVENEAPFAPSVSLGIFTATVVVTVKDVNEPPIFEIEEKHVSKSEALAVNSTVVQYTASDPDTGRKQKVMYKVIKDPAKWLNVDKETGIITVKSQMDRESQLVTEDKYTALIGAYDDDQSPATGTGTLIIKLEDVNDNPPSIVDRVFEMCNKKPIPVVLNVTDRDGTGFTFPYNVNLRDASKANWTAKMNETGTGIIIKLKSNIEEGNYKVAMNVQDVLGLSQVSTVTAKVCDCTGTPICKKAESRAAGANPWVIAGVLLLVLVGTVIALGVFLKKKGKTGVIDEKSDDDERDELVLSNEEGGGESIQQNYSESVLHFALTNKSDMSRVVMAPPLESGPRYRPRPTDTDDIAEFIDHNLKVADTDLTAPPYDSLLVFDLEGGDSEAEKLSSLYSSSDGDQGYDSLKEFGPRFKKLADMYGGGDDDMM